jgi:large subunit ribosomal protein L28
MFPVQCAFGKFLFVDQAVKGRLHMASKRNISLKKPLFGNARSFSMRATRRTFMPNYQNKRLYIPEMDRWVSVKVTVADLKTIDKIGLLAFLKRQNISIEQLL